jgi:hypothetical protein
MGEAMMTAAPLQGVAAEAEMTEAARRRLAAPL